MWKTVEVENFLRLVSHQVLMFDCWRNILDCIKPTLCHGHFLTVRKVSKHTTKATKGFVEYGDVEMSIVLNDLEVHLASFILAIHRLSNLIVAKLLRFYTQRQLFFSVPLSYYDQEIDITMCLFFWHRRINFNPSAQVLYSLENVLDCRYELFIRQSFCFKRQGVTSHF